MIGVLQWIIDLGHVVINVEVSMMSSHLALPYRGHLAEVLYNFAYLKKRKKSKIVFDPTDVEIDATKFEKKDWENSIYGDVKEELLPDMHEP